MLIGLFTGGFRAVSLLLIATALIAFLIRQPVMMAVKVYILVWALSPVLGMFG